VCENCGHKNSEELIACEECGTFKGATYYDKDSEDLFSDDEYL